MLTVHVTSTLTRLFTYAKATEAEALENFTTEALAACIRDDGLPMVAALRAVRAISMDDPDPHLAPLTQVVTPGAGVIDLVLRVQSGDRLREVWTEVKVNAAQSGKQFPTYLDYLEKVDARTRPQLVHLGPKRLLHDERLVFLPWQELWHQSRRSPSKLWHELRLFLEEKNMADAYDAPVLTREAASLGDAFGLLRKAERILLPVGVRGNELWDPPTWPATPTEVRRFLGQQFRDHGRLVIHHKIDTRAWVIAGLIYEEGETWLAVNVRSNPKHIEVRRRLIDQARTGGLPGSWERPPGLWIDLLAYRPLAAFESHQAATTWVIDKLDELKQAGIVGLLPKLAKAEPEDASAVE
jgi:hypothetical protein